MSRPCVSHRVAQFHTVSIHLACFVAVYINSMKHVQFAIYEYLDDRGKTRRSPCKLTAEEAQARYPGATPIEYTIEVRRCPETDEERFSLCSRHLAP
jgi:hypothetical protein